MSGQTRSGVAWYVASGSTPPPGTLDVSFTTNYTTTDRGYAVAVEPEPGGRIVVAGTSNGDFALLRYGERLYAQQDANHDVMSLTNGAGAVVERYQYDPYGSVKVLNGAVDKDGAVADWSADTGNASD